MESITHTVLARIISRAISQRDISHNEAANRIGIRPDTLSNVLRGRAHFTVEIVAKLGKLLARDFGAPFAQYMLSRYAQEFRLASEPKPERRSKSADEHDLRSLVSNVIALNPTTPTDILIAQICQMAHVDDEVAKTEIRFIQSRLGAGDYDGQSAF